jgi:uncharacterized protein (DUF1330 family)
MAKGYWVVFYRSVSNPVALAQYSKPAEAAILAGGGRFLTRGAAVRAFEMGIKERSVMIEFDSPAKAIEVYESPHISPLCNFSKARLSGTCAS